MKQKKILCLIFTALLIINTAGCAGIASISLGDRTLSVGVQGLTGALNPFYCDNETDEIVLAQIFRPIQRSNGKGGFVNFCGGITYEKVENGVKYTVNIRDNLTFSDGTPVTIDDVIAFYYFIADASYDGKYSDWHLNSIQGLAEYYYDDADCTQAINDIEMKIITDYTRATIGNDDFISYLTATALDGKWGGDIDGASPYGGTWREQLVKAGYEQALEDLGDTPASEKVLAVVADEEASVHPSQYNPEKYWRNKLYSDYIAKNYSDGIDVSTISGIKKINDYACTVLFTQPNIDAVSQINIPVVSAAYYFSEYKKGGAATVKDITASALGAGPYAFRDYDAQSGKLTLVANAAGNEKCGFDIVEFIETPDDEAVSALVAGTLDIIEIPASASVVSALNSDLFKTSFSEQPCYYSFFFNAKSLPLEVRTALMCLNDYTAAIDGKIGKYFTAVHLPMNITLYDGISSGLAGKKTDVVTLLASAGYAKDASGNCVRTVEGEDGTRTAEQLTLRFCYPDECDETALTVISEFEKVVKSCGISINTVPLRRNDFDSRVASGGADVWFDAVCDTAAGNKYIYYHSAGRLNFTGIKDSSLDSMLSGINALPASQRGESVKEMLKALNALAVEMPVYQRKTITAYNTQVIDAASVPEVSDISGMIYSLSTLEAA